MLSINSPARQNALAFAARGFRVLAIKPRSKIPEPRFCPEGYKSATLDLPTVKGWFETEPSLNYGVVTGNLVAVDIDPRNGGDWRKLLGTTHGDIHTWQIATGGGGEHKLFFSRKEAIASGKLAAGIDLKGAGGYIVGPGSQHESGSRYRWHADANPANTKIAPLPAWLVEMAAKPKEWDGKPRSPAYFNSLIEPAVEGERNERITRLFGHLYGSMFPDRVVLCDLMLTWNRIKCTPPLEDAEVIEIARSIARTEDKKRGLR